MYTLSNYTKKEYIMSLSERECYKELYQMLDGKYLLFPQIHLDAFLQVDPPFLSKKIKLFSFRHINQKSVDFVVSSLDFKPILAIELDGSSHRSSWVQRKDKKKEMIIKNAGLILIRIKNYEYNDKNKMLQSLSLHLPLIKETEMLSFTMNI